MCEEVLRGELDVWMNSQYWLKNKKKIKKEGEIFNRMNYMGTVDKMEMNPPL